MATCDAKVYVRDEYRLVRGSGFAMHYSAKRCSHPATADGLCTQHARMLADGRGLTRIPDWPVHPRARRRRANGERTCPKGQA
jgi:hypothetical protein